MIGLVRPKAKKPQTVRQAEMESFIDKYAPRKNDDFTDFVSAGVICEINKWIESRKNNPLGHKGSEHQVLCIVGPSNSGKTSLPKVMLATCGYSPTIFDSSTENLKFKNIYDIAVCSNRSDRSTVADGGAIILDDIDTYQDFQWTEFSKSLTLHKPAIGKRLKAKAEEIAKKKDEQEERRKQKEKEKVKPVTKLKLNLPLQPNLKGKKRKFEPEKKEKVKEKDYDGFDDSSDDEIEKKSASDDDENKSNDATKTTEEEEEEEKKKSKSKLNIYGLSGKYSSPLACPIICTMTDAKFGGKVIKSDSPLAKFLSKCKRIYLNGFNEQNMRTVLSRVCAGENISLDKDEIRGIIKITNCDIRAMLNFVEFRVRTDKEYSAYRAKLSTLSTQEIKSPPPPFKINFSDVAEDGKNENADSQNSFKTDERNTCSIFRKTKEILLKGKTMALTSASTLDAFPNLVEMLHFNYPRNSVGRIEDMFKFITDLSEMDSQLASNSNDGSGGNDGGSRFVDDEKKEIILVDLVRGNLRPGDWEPARGKESSSISIPPYYPTITLKRVNDFLTSLPHSSLALLPRWNNSQSMLDKLLYLQVLHRGATVSSSSPTSKKPAKVVKNIEPSFVDEYDISDKIVELEKLVFDPSRQPAAKKKKNDDDDGNDNVKTPVAAKTKTKAKAKAKPKAKTKASAKSKSKSTSASASKKK